MTLAIQASSNGKAPGRRVRTPCSRPCALSARRPCWPRWSASSCLCLIGGWPAFHKFGFGFFVTSDWNPVHEVFGAAGPIVGTLVTSVLALAGLPVAFGVAFFLVELCPTILRRPIGTAVELLAGIPSIVYGMWGCSCSRRVFAQHVELP